MSAVDAPAARSAVFFDFDGTLVDSTIVHYYRYFMRRRLSPFWRQVWYAGFLVKCLGYLLLDKIDRSKFNVVFYRSYRGLSVSQIKSLARDCHRDEITPRLFGEVNECIADHKRERRTVVLVTGSIDFIVAPLVEQLGVDAVVAPALLESDGRFTGELDGQPVGGEEKARRMRGLADKMKLDLAESHAYGDSVSDLPMLEVVGHPHAVNPGRKLAAIARKRDWPVHKWTRRQT